MVSRPKKKPVSVLDRTIKRIRDVALSAISFVVIHWIVHFTFVAIQCPLKWPEIVTNWIIAFMYVLWMSYILLSEFAKQISDDPEVANTILSLHIQTGKPDGQ